MAYIAGVEHLKHNVMKAQDLRLGNLYMRGNKVEEFTDQVMHEVIYGALQHCEPIPLTEEWLGRFGFLWVYNEAYSNKKQWTLQVVGSRLPSREIDKDETWFDGIGDYSWRQNSFRRKTMVVHTICRGNYVCSKVVYVHQLQNLYHALTGEELTLTQ